jgi:hypothetical protein
MLELAAILLNTVFYAGGLWGAVKIFDRYNTRNSFYLALAIGLTFALIMPFLGLLFGLLPLMALLFLLAFHYRLGYLQAILVILAEGLILYITGLILVDMLGDFGNDTAVAWVIVVAFGLFVGFVIHHDVTRRKSGVRDPKDKAPIPPARARRKRTRTPARPVPAKVVQPAARPSTPPPLPPPPSQAATEPKRAPEPESTRPLPEAGDDPDEPRFLR